MDHKQTFQQRIQSSIQLKTALLSDDRLMDILSAVTNSVIDAYRAGGKILWCGNGGSAADAQHLAAELSGRFYYDRPPLNSEALHVNSSYVTAVANDYGYDIIYSRLVEAMGQKGDMLMALSTSGNSANVINALMRAKERGMITVGFTGETGGKMKAYCDHLVNIPSADTPRIQECHMLVGHTICELTEAALFPKK